MISSHADAGNSVPHPKPENIGFGGRSDERESAYLIHLCQPNINRALTRVNLVPASKSENKLLVHRAKSWFLTKFFTAQQ